MKAEREREIQFNGSHRQDIIYLAPTKPDHLSILIDAAKANHPDITLKLLPKATIIAKEEKHINPETGLKTP